MAVTDTPPRLLTAHDLLRLYSEGVRGELIRGTLCETMPTGHEHGMIVANLVILLGSFIKPRKLGRLTASDSGVWLERDPDTVREPDIAYFSALKIPLDQRAHGLCAGRPRPGGGSCIARRQPAGDQRQGAHVAQLRDTTGMGRASRHPHRRHASGGRQHPHAHPERRAPRLRRAAGLHLRRARRLRCLTSRRPSRAIPRPLGNTRNRSHGQDRRPCRYRHHDGRDPGLRPAWHIPCGA